jgi:hypothetical protein
MRIKAIVLSAHVAMDLENFPKDKFDQLEYQGHMEWKALFDSR